MKIVLVAVKNKPYLFKDETTGIYYFRRYQKNRGQLKKSLKSDIYKNIEAEYLKLLKQYHEPVQVTSPIRNLILDEWKHFLATHRGKARNTFISIETQGRLHLLPYFGILFPEEVNENTWEDFILTKRAENKNRKFFNDRKYLLMFFNWLKREGRIMKIPRLRDPDPKDKIGKVLNIDEIKAVLDNAEGDLKLQILMGLTMGMRVGEILGLTWDRVDLRKRTISLFAQHTKIRKPRTFGINDAVYLILEEKKQFHIGPVFPSPTQKNKTVGKGGNKKSWSTCKRKAQVNCRFHDLRHTFLTSAFKKSINPALICNYAGLSLDEAEKTYLHFTVDDTRAVADVMKI